MADLPIEPRATGLLRVGGGDQIYWETSGNPRGKPLLYLTADRAGARVTVATDETSPLIDRTQAALD